MSPKPTRIQCLAIALSALALLALAGPARAGEQVARAPLPPALQEGAPIVLVYLDVRDAAGAEVADPELRGRLEAAFGHTAGTPFSIAAADLGAQQVRGLVAVASASWALYESSSPGEVVLVLSVIVDPAAPAVERRGWIATGSAGEFPTLFESGRSLLRVQLNGGLGLFNDRNAWWGDPDAFVGGSPLFPDPAGEGWANWGEASVEAGVHGAAQLGPRKLFAFGSVTGVAAGSTGQDLWRSDTRFEVELEKAYGGLLFVAAERDLRLVVSYGRQTWQLNKGFLFSQYAGSFNAAQWGASYLAARTALEQTLLAKLRWSKLSIEAFVVDPQEYPLNDSGTEYRGVNLQYLDGRRLELGAVYYEVPDSKSTYLLPDGGRVPRRGLRTTNLRLATSRLGGIDGLAFESEVAHQSNEHFEMSADAWYASLGYELADRDWRPSLTYRYAFFEGDDPATRPYERFDAPQSSGSDNWLQGNIFKKTVVNSNLKSHRVRLALAPSQEVGVTLNYFYLWADEKNNRGGARPLQLLPTRTLGQELDVTVSWAISRRLFLLAFAGYAEPGSALEKALPEGARPWSTVQLSLFWNL
jgi:hypothetical protein